MLDRSVFTLSIVVPGKSADALAGLSVTSVRRFTSLKGSHFFAADDIFWWSLAILNLLKFRLVRIP